MANLGSLLYVSQARRGVAGSAIERILEVARTNNARDDITGAVLLYGDRFLQMLEGAPDKVDACFERIRIDPRHKVLRVLERAPIEARRFGPWAMRHVQVDQARDPAVAGFLARLGAPDEPAAPFDPSCVALAKALLLRMSEPSAPGTA